MIDKELQQQREMNDNLHKYKAIAKDRLYSEGWYDYDPGTEFKIAQISRPMIQIEDWLGFKHWIKSDLLELVEVETLPTPLNGDKNVEYSLRTNILK